MFSNCIEKFDVSGYESVSPKDKKDCCLNCYFRSIALFVHDY